MPMGQKIVQGKVYKKFTSKVTTVMPTSDIQNTYKYMAIQFVTIFEHHEVFLLVITTNAGAVCCFQISV